MQGYSQTTIIFIVWSSSAPAHFFTVIYLSSVSTRAGLASLNTMCKRTHGTTNINSDYGLQTAGMIAHETGHKWVIFTNKDV